MAAIKRKDDFKAQSGFLYDGPLEISVTQKLSFSKIFLNLQGNSWCSNFGWIGQTQVFPLQ